MKLLIFAPSFLLASGLAIDDVFHFHPWRPFKTTSRHLLTSSTISLIPTAKAEAELSREHSFSSRKSSRKTTTTTKVTELSHKTSSIKLTIKPVTIKPKISTSTPKRFGLPTVDSSSKHNLNSLTPSGNPATITSTPTYSSFPLGPIPCFTTPDSSFTASQQANAAIETVCISSQTITLRSGGPSSYSAVASGISAAVSLVESPSCGTRPLYLDAERCLMAFWSISDQCPAYGGSFVFDISLGCLRLSLNGQVHD